MTIRPLLVLVMLAASPASAGEIADRLRGPVSFTLASATEPHDLELCVADALSSFMAVAAFRDGASRTVVTGTLTGLHTKLVAAVELNGTPIGTTIVGRILGRGNDDRMRERIRLCL